MYKTKTHSGTKLRINNSMVGERFETKIERITVNKEPITDGAEIIYTDRKEGVIPAYNIRTDRFDVALDAMTVVAKTDIAKRAGKVEEKSEEKGEENVGDEPTQGTEN